MTSKNELFVIYIYTYIYISGWWWEIPELNGGLVRWEHHPEAVGFSLGKNKHVT